MRLRVQEFRQFVELDSFYKCAKVSYGVLTSVSWRVKEFREFVECGFVRVCKRVWVYVGEKGSLENS